MTEAGVPDVYGLLAKRWSRGLWGWAGKMPALTVIETILKENLDPGEAAALLDIPVRKIPLEIVALDEIAASSDLSEDELERILDGIAVRGLVFAGKTPDGRKGYALLKANYGFSQIFYWPGDSPRARRMAEIESDPDYVDSKRRVHRQSETKMFRYVAVSEALDPKWQHVYPADTVEQVIERAERIAVAHCPCRVRYELTHGHGCGHSTEVCVKFDDLAGYAIDAGLATEIDRDRALAIMRQAVDEGMVHFADNTADGIRHICNCCGCACWAVGPTRRREVARDEMMATYFLRATDEDLCVGCGVCADICPVQAVEMTDGVARTDLEWCIGCGVCIPRCPVQAISLVEKQPRPITSATFSELHTRAAAEHESLFGEGDGE